jgi:transposase
MFNGNPGKKRSDAERLRAIELLRKGRTVRQVAELLKISESAIRNWQSQEKKKTS